VVFFTPWCFQVSKFARELVSLPELESFQAPHPSPALGTCLF
jgi:hypothetical protein